MLRTLVAGVAGGITMNLVMLLTFRAIGFGWNVDGILLTSSIPFTICPILRTVVKYRGRMP